MAEVDTKSIYLVDADRVEKLLDIIQNTVDMPNVPCIKQAAANEVAQIEHDLWVQMYPDQAAAEEAAQKEREKVEAERQKKAKEASTPPAEKKEEHSKKEEEKPRGRF